jgi:hypothetical protein
MPGARKNVQALGAPLQHEALLSAPWSVAADRFQAHIEALPSGAPMRRVSRRNAIAQAIIDGNEVEAFAAGEYPDIVQLGQAEDIPVWALQLLRKPSKCNRYVWLEGGCYFVQTSGGDIVSAVEWCESLKKPLHRVDTVDPLMRAKALALARLVAQYLADPRSQASLVSDLFTGRLEAPTLDVRLPEPIPDPVLREPIIRYKRPRRTVAPN